MRRTSDIREALDKLNIINEDPRRRVLDEDLRGYFRNQYLNKGVFGEIPEGPAQAKKKAEQDAYAKALAVAKLDPTFTGKDIENAEDALNKQQGAYFDWLMRMIKKGVITYDEMMRSPDAFTDSLAQFNDYKRRNKLPADKKDIMRFKSLNELTELLSSLGGDIEVTDDGNGTSFKKAVQNIRGALQVICGFKEDEIPDEIKSTEDCLTLICETSGWECWKINSVWGAMLADCYGIDWGGGATWCTGGQYLRGDRPRKGMELYNSAIQHYPNYTRNGYVLYFFQQKDNSVRRPKNKAQFQVYENYSVHNLFHADDRPISLTEDGKLSYSNGYSYHDTADVMTVFIQTYGLLDALKNSSLGGIEPIIDAENMARLEAGEPYIYTGGRIKDAFKNSIRTIKFTYDGKEYTVDAVANPTFLRAENVNDMFNIKELSEGKPFVYEDGAIKELFRPAIRTLKFKYGDKEYTVNVENAQDTIFKCESPEQMFNLVQLREGKPYVYTGERRIPEFLQKDVREIVFDLDNYTAFVHNNQEFSRKSTEETQNDRVVPAGAFNGCTNVEIIRLPEEITYIGAGALKDVPETAVMVTPRFPDRKFHINPRDIEKVRKIVKYTNEDVLAFGEE